MDKNISWMYVIFGLALWAVMFVIFIAVYPITLIFIMVGIYSFLPESTKSNGGVYLKIGIIILYFLLIGVAGHYIGSPALYDDLR